jgi:hypothetical protein
MSRDRFNFLSYLMEDDEDDEEDDALLVMILASVPLEKKRASFHVRDRLEWGCHVAQLENEGPRGFSCAVPDRSSIIHQTLFPC